ncbi:MAG: phosphomannomutase/phosphoglucomutase [Xanthomonadales bacterium]|nr:phosphomannomutase/phosphoglucomutase [Xanthomonadales bacterium]
MSTINIKTNLNSLPWVKKLHLDRVKPMLLIFIGLVLLVSLSLTLFLGGASHEDNEKALEAAKQTMGQVSSLVQDFRRVLEDQQVQELAAIAVANPERFANLRQYLNGRIPELIDARLFDTQLGELRATDLGPYGYAVLDMLLETESGFAPLQIHGTGEDAYLAMTVRIGEADSPLAYLLVRVKPSTFLSTSLQKPGSFVLDQYNGRFQPTLLSPLARPLTSKEHLVWLRVPASLFRIGVVQEIQASSSMGVLRPVLLVAGIFLLVLGAALKLRPIQAPLELKEDPEEIEPPDDSDTEDVPDLKERLTADTEMTTSPDSGDGLGAIELPDLGFRLENPQTAIKRSLPAVELVESIFRAYDIRGIVGETLDATVARQVGQVVGTLTLEQQAGPVIVARDGRNSGPELVKGMIEGIASTGCDVVDIGAVPTGVLYFAAYELGNGTGVMVTGSHNPPNYNGFKMLIGGVTQAGDQITDMFQRIQSGNLRLGKGNITEEEMLGQYREKISADIQLSRPLKVVADCGNGIGGVCAADVLRDIGADVISLYDEVDGTFPNHHPDPSEPENLKDLIESVTLMGADIGVAFDGDADRLGVVTPSGEIIYSDRLMMLFAKDILSRVPGSTIIYDVKCTGHLQHVIEEAGGKAMMYKTGHSLIKNKMKEVDAPFAGEMSGHFFFKERWYGFDCGIYSAARLLEILANDERGVEEILGSLPNSVSTPELKVQMNEGENHAFITEMQEKARFSDARINTIDGVRADYPDGWGLVRASNTTPILVVRFDADTEEALQRIKLVFKQQMLAINPELKLPF